MIRPHRSARARSAHARLALAAVALATVSACAQSPRAAAPASAAGASDPRRISQAYDLLVDAQRYEKQNKPDAAIAAYRAALENYREFPAAWNNLGALLMDRQRYLEAAECFNVAADLAPQDPRPVFNLGLSWDRAGYLADALDHYQRAVERDPQYLPALRGAIRAESLLNRTGANTLQRLRTALQLEQDPKWRSWMEMQRLRIESAAPGQRIGPPPPGAGPIQITPTTSPAVHSSDATPPAP